MFNIVALLALVISACLATPFGTSAREFTSHRLPNTTIPTHYELYLDTNVHIGEFEYTGNLQISITVLESTKQIVLHSIRSVINRLELRNSNEQSVAIYNFDFDADKEFLLINCKEVLPIGTTYKIYIDFTNSLDRDDTVGFYRSYYENAEGITKYLALTQFEPCDARSAFPCYDEPGIKATFNIKIACGVDYHARSNSPALGITILPDGKKLTTFQTTPRMQTYLVAFLVSDYVIERQVINEPKQLAVSTLARPTAKHLLTYSVEASVKFIRELEIYFNHSYEMSKIDNVAVNNNHFWAGAMENWGLVTYRESTILFDPETQGESMQLSVVGIVGHEYTHQFFGNLLAPKWWSYLWLNEGFARLYQYYVSEYSHPELNMRERFSGVRETALNTDANPTVRPMTHYVETPSEINTLFDNIAYAKSASVLRMMNYALSESTFQKGLRYYIQQNKDHGVVTEQDLFDSLAQAVKEDEMLPPSITIHEVFSSWSNQPGAPLVNVRRIGDTNMFSFSQERFYREPQEVPGEESWWIPITYFTPSSEGKYNSSAAFWMPPNLQEVSYEIELQEGDFVLINPLARGYYRVNYDSQSWENVIYNLYENADAIDNLSKSQLIDDSMNLAHAGKLDYYTAFKIFDYLQYETDYIPWATAASTLKFFHRMLRHDQESLNNLEKYAAQLAGNLLSVHGINSVKGESANAADSRLIGLEWACKKDLQCQAESRVRFDKLERKAPLVLTSKAEQQIVCHQFQEINFNDFAIILESLKSTHDQNVRSHLIEALACAENEIFIVEYLNTINTNYFEYSEKLRAIQAIYQKSLNGLNAVLDLFDKSSPLLEKITQNRREFLALLANLAEYTVESKSVAKLTKFIQKVAPALLPTIEAALQFNQRWVQRNAIIVSDMLNNPPSVEFDDVRSMHESGLVQLCRAANAHIFEMGYKVIYLIVAILCLTGGTCFESFRLPNNTIPTHYNLFIDTNIHEGILEYNGTVEIHIKVLENTKQIVLHSSRSTLVDISLKNSEHVSIKIVNFEFEKEREFLILNTASMLTEGSTLWLKIDFINSIDRGDRSGFYRTTYNDDDGVLKYAGITQFQACEARSSFSCYDEPGIKATFDVRITCGVDYHARSNADIAGISILPGGKKLVTFQRSPAMQTYLLAFLVSDFAVQRDFANSFKKITVQSMARPTYADQLEYSLDASIKLINELQTYFDHPYEMKKIDSVGIRNIDFSAGAMENWGLVTYLESYFLISETSSESSKRGVATVIAHEFTHQFFGNLLAPKWWSYLWLNEGFATLYEYYLSDRTHPELQIKNRFPGSALQAALQIDGSATIRPMTHYVETVPEIDRLFDTIAYDKSGSVLRMMHYALGEQTFLKGLRYYIKEYQNSVVEPQNLFDNLQKAAIEDRVLPPNSTMTKILGSWSEQPGAPVIQVERIPDSEDIIFRQTRYFSTAQSTENDQTWWIPIFVYTNKSEGAYEQTPLFWLPQGSKEIVKSIPIQDDDIIIVNPAQKGYYRVNYDPQMWKHLVSTLHSKPEKIDLLTRGQLIDDSMNLAHAGQLNHETSFQILDHLRNSSEFLPWQSAYRNLIRLEKMLTPDRDALDLFRQYLRILTKTLMETYGREERKGEHPNDHDARVIAIDLSCRSGLEKCIDYAKRKMNIAQQRSNLLVIQSETEKQWYCNGLRNARQAEVQFFKEALKVEKDSLGRVYLSNSLACVGNRALLEQVMELLAEDAANNAELTKFLSTAILYSEVGLEASLAFLYKKVEQIDELIGNRRKVEKLLCKIANEIVDRPSAVQLLQLAKMLHISSDLEQTIKVQLDEQIRWQERNVGLVHEALKKYL
ncbi:uncharacterized protein LOC131693292 [Topomyia yanbarensis]|uniref:uncharacterized protein LOC131693292 n=1 Tax=Topomyia yanbarensis TaxID=2498891 RepID=UPI00273C8D6C|nr:uncharacterized protein LOC131693292 [Topomyia yanbarensis]